MQLKLRKRLWQKGRKSKALIFGVTAIIYAIIIFYLSSQSQPPEIVEPFVFNFDKLAHLLEFGLFGALLFMTFAYADWRPWDAPLAMTLGIIYGVVDEFHQFFVPGRVADLLDALVNAIGVVIVVAILAYFDRKWYQPPLSEESYKV